MLDFLDKLRLRSPEERMFIAFAAAGSITAIIAIVWIVSFSATMTKGVAPVAGDMPLDALRRQIDGTIEEGQRFMGSISDLQQTLSATTSVASASEGVLSATSSESGARDVGGVLVSTSSSATPSAPLATSSIESIGP